MAGQFGNEKVTTQNLEVVAVRPEENLLLVRGAVPGATNGVVIIRRAVKERIRG
jgi:large subunit ribosomal protein L3